MAAPDGNTQLIRQLIALSGGIAALVFGILLYGAFGGYIEKWSFDRGEMPEVVEGGTYLSASQVDSNGIHIPTGLVYAPGLPEVQRNCLACHSSKLIAQNLATREGWIQIISWMQRTQGLWDLGEDREVILDYLSAHYAPEERGRRANLDVDAIEWYELEQ